MLYTRTGARSWRAVALAAGVTALVLATWIALDLQRLRTHQGLLPATPDSAAGSFAFVCALVGPSLPYLGAALVPSALAVMAPCLLQMSIVLVTAITGTTVTANSGTSQPRLWRRGVAFAAGFLGSYALAALALGLLGEAFVDYAFVLKALGGAMILLLGLAVLRVLPRHALSGCRGPRWLIMTGRATLRRPFGAGVAFAIYCVGCCGPYLSGLALLGAGAGAAWQGAALILGFALLMGAVLLLPIFALPASQRFGQALMRRAKTLAALSGVALVVIGTALVLEPFLIWLLAYT